MTPIGRIIPTILLILLSCIVKGQEAEQKLFLNGYIKNLHQLYTIDRLDELQWTSLIHNRLNFKYVVSNKWYARIEFRNRIFNGDALSNIPGFSNVIGMDNGWIDLSWNLVDSQEMLINTTIDRALVRYTSGKWDISLGRQRINWGKNLIWNPNDIFNTYNFLDFDYEERPGSDALRVQYYTGDFTKIELAAKKGKEKEDVILALLYGTNLGSYDLQFISGIYQNDWVVGTGWAGNLKNMGFKGEVSYFVPYKNYEFSKNVISASSSLDYAFKNGLYLNGSVLYNNTADNGLGIENVMVNLLTAKNLMPFEFSGFIQLTKEFSPILSATFNGVYSPTNQSVILMPNLKYSLATDWELDFTGQSFFEFEEYRTLGNSIYVRLRWSY